MAKSIEAEFRAANGHSCPWSGFSASSGGGGGGRQAVKWAGGNELSCKMSTAASFFLDVTN